MPPLIGLSLAAAAIEPILPGAATALAWLAGWCAAWIALVAELVAAWPSAQVRSPEALAVILSVVATSLALRRLPRYRRRNATVGVVSVALALSAAACAFRPMPSWSPPSGLRLTVLDVGQGDAILVEAPGAALLVDQGPPEADVAGQLRRLGIRSLSAIVLTHPQRDHVGGAAGVLARLRVATVLDPRLAVRGPEYGDAVDAARDRGVPVVEIRAGDTFTIGALHLDVLWPEDSGLPGEDPNLNATVIHVRFGETDALLTADAESDVTRRLRLRPVEILKVAHHGSEDPGLPELLRTLRPRLALISVGQGNDYDHPRPETIAALTAVPGLTTARTDLDGRIVVESDGRTITVSSER
jgi:competence protein ComEC